MTDPDFDAAKLQLYGDVNLGVAMREFLSGEIGRYLMGRALDVIKDARDVLEEVGEDDREALRKAQKEAKAARLAMQWVSDAVQNGNAAERTLIEEGG